MTTGEMYGLAQLQAAHPDKRVYLDARGCAIVDPNQPPLPEVVGALDAWRQKVNEGIGQSSLLQLELEQQGV